MPAFRQVGEKQLPNPVLCMAWSPKRDLIALANTTGELLLHRLASFQRVWSLPPSEYTGKEITALAWRPDGKILAFSLGDTKQVVLCGVEKAEILHVFPMQNPVTCMHWMEVMEENSALSSFYNSEDESKLFLPKLPTLPKSYSTTSKIFSEEKSDEIMNLLGEVRLNILVLGGDDGFVELYAYGMYKIATLTGVSGTCRSLSLSSDLKSLSVITEVRSADNNPEICYIQLDTALLSDCLPEVTRMARKFTHISTLLQYLHLSLTCMCEAWEDILMQMDLRLTKFVQEKNTSTQVQDEFLELLLWGQSSPELQALLMNQLTVKGLKKLGQSIESSYSSIQKLVISHLQSGSEALLYHLSEVKGMSLWKQKFEPLGLDSAAIEGAITAVGSFSLKANELLQVIDKSMKNFKAFFRWLYVAMLRMCEEHVPPELNKMTQKDIAFVADFLSEHFSQNEELFDRKGKYFNVERVGQYLKDEDDDLVSPPNTKGNQWLKFLQESTHLKESPLLFPSYPQKSLHFVKRMMESVIEQCLQKPAEIIGKSVNQAVFLPLYTVPESSENTPRLFELPSLWNDKKAKMHYVVFCMPEISPCKLYLLRKGTDPNRHIPNSVMSIDLSHHIDNADDDNAAAQSEYVYSCLDARFYDDEMLTVVLQGVEDNSWHVLAQLPLASTLSCETEFKWEPNLRLDQQGSAIPCQGLVLGNQWRELESMKAQFVAVNGIRKVACVLSANLRHIRVFEMDVEDEDEEGADSQNASADQEGLETTMTSQGQGEEREEAEGEAGECGGDGFQKTEEHLESEEALELS
ncbi:anaphase-promoting complex subunit 4 isoform X1 [Lates calcarifer]|uniref:Anaphase-promoting complex subunit 4 n=1 Tax=Lates calcarifer TaxID=8187 RepID=A0A4W6E377_LATCA|nr:anaphase-promoting complex subunit 4 isoform X1 [Lates calcarifer]XP_018525435.1 anaphase-promoting complex subunit 4 isoform X1 [Lates calcarifer]XP_018525436.1 anaphase-promoting complex subunit 4 isoform X1 [Lates calcarifer]XP_018525437.1 anaphase-promoting complex subunit 4 isoform X1 [Lates calcarifer]XP_050933278.1 anaphase-promoting complex subunit 4 isoform X1 [Lates calcarifer]XP_050933279.1 anaphase-promoting complex subunit 4 isoform X1 [Lates calcarifer]